jgi:hypothetical protein
MTTGYEARDGVQCFLDMEHCLPRALLCNVHGDKRKRTLRCEGRRYINDAFHKVLSRQALALDWSARKRPHSPPGALML